MDKTKTCKTCKVVKPETDFGIDRAQRDGRRATCKQCRSMDDDWKPDPTKTKKCFTCKDEKPETHFYIHRGKCDGLESSCILCSAYNNHKSTAKCRKKETSLTKEEFMSLVLQPCDYCKTGYTNETVKINGIDRGIPCR
jgi:hypothetical protein